MNDYILLIPITVFLAGILFSILLGLKIHPSKKKLS